MALLVLLILVSLTAWSLYRQWHAQSVLFVAAVVMLLAALALNTPQSAAVREGIPVVSLLVDSFASSLSGVGLMIMSIGGFVAYSDRIGASESLVVRSMRALERLKLPPNLLVLALIPLGQLIFVCVTSAAGLAVLLMASAYPVMVRLGVRPVTAASVITGTTAFGIGPASALTAAAAKAAGISVVDYVVLHQMLLAMPLMIAIALLYGLSNWWFDRRAEPVAPSTVAAASTSAVKPWYYAVVPVLPILLMVGSYFATEAWGPRFTLTTTASMFMSFGIAWGLHTISTRNLREAVDSIAVFWKGMGDIFTTVVTLVLVSEVFADGLIALGFMEGLLAAIHSLGAAESLVVVAFVLLIFFASILMGSGNAAFFSFSPLIPDVAARFGLSSVRMLLPMNLAASLGRTVSPISGVLLAVAALAKVSPMDLAKRNAIPVAGSLLLMLLIQLFA
ncbi:MAG: C4-dicarboxylate transporter DcuC [Schleiferiaceae bacterium]